MRIQKSGSTESLICPPLPRFGFTSPAIQSFTAQPWAPASLYSPHQRLGGKKTMAFRGLNQHIAHANGAKSWPLVTEPLLNRVGAAIRGHARPLFRTSDHLNGGKLFCSE